MIFIQVKYFLHGIALFAIIQGFFAPQKISAQSSTDWPKLAEHNSRYELVTNDNKKELVWAIIQARIFVNGPNFTGSGGFMGTAWIVRINENSIVFVTSAHVMRDAFHSKIDKPDTIFVLLTHPSNISFSISRANVELKNQDIAFIRISKEAFSHFEKKTIESPALEKSLEYKNIIGKNVYNLGFPDRAQRHDDIYFKINITPPPSATFDKGPWKQFGLILDVINTTLQAPDVNLKNAKCLLLNYTSEKGFSGGPLILENNHVIGMMSAVLPTQNGSPPTHCLAIHISEILLLLDE